MPDSLFFCILGQIKHSELRFFFAVVLLLFYFLVCRMETLIPVPSGAGASKSESVCKIPQHVPGPGPVETFLLLHPLLIKTRGGWCLASVSYLVREKCTK